MQYQRVDCCASSICASITSMCDVFQMDDAIVPSQRALLFGKVTAILQAIFLGVPTIITTALSFCMCGPFCIDWKLTGAELWRSAVRVAQQHLTMWGGAWLFVVVMLPLYIIAGSIFVTWFVLRCIVWVCREGTKRSWRYIHRCDARFLKIYLIIQFKTFYIIYLESGSQNSNEVLVLRHSLLRMQRALPLTRPILCPRR